MVGAALVGLCAVAVWWWATGGRWLTVDTPSMGTAAPVGTVLWVKPTDIGDIDIGDIVTFRTPDAEPRAAGTASSPTSAPSRTYTHRVVARHGDGTLQTKGDLNAAPDPWHTDQQHLVGRVAARWVGIGWLVKALPLLILGGLVWWVLTGLLASRRSRAPLRVVGAAVLVAGAISLHKPLFSAVRVSFVPIGAPGARATFVGTGLLPAELRADGVPPVVVHLGEMRSITVPHADETGRFRVEVVPAIPWQTWAIVAGACFMPAVWSMIVGVEPSPPRRPRGRAQREPAAPPLEVS